MKGLTIASVVTMLAVLSAGCGGVRHQSIRTSSRVLPPRPDTAAVHIYRAGQRPDFPYEEVGVVSATKQASSAFGSARIGDVIGIIQDQARALGADAIILQEASEYMSPSLNGSLTIPAASVSGIAIAYVRAAPAVALVLPGNDRRRPSEALSTPEIVALASPSVVQIETEKAQGSGVVITSDGLLLTNQHVIAGATAIIVKTSTGRRSVAVVQAADSLADIALLRASLDSVPPALLGSVSRATAGADVVIIGSPLGLTQTVSRGVLSSIRVVNGRRLIQTDAAVSPGNSGGPMLNENGEVIGIVSFKLSRPLAEGLSFALAIDDALAAVGVARSVER